MPMPSLDPSDPKHATYIIRKGDAKAEYLALIKAALSKAVQNINFVDLFQIMREHEAIMPKVNRDVICIGIKYSVKVEPIYFNRDELIPALEKHLCSILLEILDCNHQRHNSA